MYNKLIFYNHYGAGDIYESREFVKAWRNLVPANQYLYAHVKHPRILLDIPEIGATNITSEMDPMKAVSIVDGDTLLINTWIGRDGKYVLPGIGCTVEKLYQMHNDMLGVVGAGSLPGAPLDYIPNINYDFFYLYGCNTFLNEHPEDKIIIDNGLVQSNQAANFDFNPMISIVAGLLKDKCFIVTHPFHNMPNNVFSTDEIVGKNLGFDLPEISYLSTHCRVLIGRNSGPHVHMQTRDNVMDGNKSLLSFTYHYLGSSFVVNTDVLIRKFWSPQIITTAVVDKMLEVIG